MPNEQEKEREQEQEHEQEQEPEQEPNRRKPTATNDTILLHAVLVLVTPRSCPGQATINGSQPLEIPLIASQQVSPTQHQEDLKTAH